MPSLPIQSHAPPRVVLAPNAFKGSLTARAAAAAMAEGVARALPGALLDEVPVADGGDGSVDAFVSCGFTRHVVRTTGPTGTSGDASVALRGDVAVVELAGSCGMARLPGGIPAPLTSTTTGLGDAVRAALDLGARRLVVCLGGSASTDGGTGLLVALGARLLSADGAPVPPGGAGLARISGLDLSGLDPRLAGVHVTVAVDVTSPLTGPDGAAPVFGPQKGASAAEVDDLDAGLRSWAAVLARATGRDVERTPGAGAAGGTAAALLAVLGPVIEPGSVVIAAAIGLDARIAAADLVVTGEGRLDAQSRLGKGSGLVAERAGAAGVPVLAVCGRIDLPAAGLRAMGFAGWHDCVSLATDEAEAIAHAGELVARATERAVTHWSAG